MTAINKIIKSFRGRLIIAFMLAIFTAFLVMGTLFSSEVNTALRMDRAEQLQEATNEIVRVVINKINSGDADLTKDSDIASYLDFVNRTYGAYVWMVAPNGLILMDTGIPAEATTQMINLPDDRVGEEIEPGELPSYGEGQRPLLGMDHVGLNAHPYGTIYTGGNYLGLFGNSRTQVWLSVVRPVYDIAGNPALVIQVHERYNINAAVVDFLVEAMRLSVSIAFLIAFIMIVVISLSISRPLKELSEAANRVAMGDLSVRVKRPVHKPSIWSRRKKLSPEQQAAMEQAAVEIDEISVLIETFNRMIERLDHANSDRRDFISSISHDLRTPLTSISGFVGGMIDGTIPPERYDHYLEIVQSEAKRLSNLVSEMNDAVKLDTNDLTYNFVPFAVGNMINNVVSSLESLILPKQISVQTNISEISGMKVIGDEEQLSRVLYNLVSNAIKFTPEEGVIAVMVQHPVGSRSIEVIVEDSGPGIDEQDLAHIFERFYKSDRSRTGHQGSGLGLYIARSILTAHGQHISVGQSQMGGAKFTFTLQLA